MINIYYLLQHVQLEFSPIDIFINIFYQNIINKILVRNFANNGLQMKKSTVIIPNIQYISSPESITTNLAPISAIKPIDLILCTVCFANISYFFDICGCVNYM